MSGFLARRLRVPSRRDDGIALVVAIALIMLVAVLLATLIAMAMYESRATGRDRQRSQAVMSAEQAVDTLMSLVNNSPVASAPCGDASGSISVVSDRLEMTSAVTYYDEDGVKIDDCTAIQSGSVRAYTAHITATATSEPLADQAPARRTVEMLVELSPEFGNDLTKAIVGSQGITFANKVTLTGEDGQPNADMYTDGDVVCDNNQVFHGSVYAQGSVRMSSSCHVLVDVHSNGFRADNNKVTVNGQILSTSDVVLNAEIDVGQQILSRGAITLNGQGALTCAPPSKCFPNATVPAVPHQDFPILNGDQGTIDDWINDGGYTTVVRFGPGQPAPFNQCGWYNGPDLVGPDGKSTNLNGKGDYVAAWIFANGYKLSGPTLIRSTCTNGVTFQGIDIEINDNLAVFADGGITFSNTNRMTSTTADEHNLYLIQPYDTPVACPTWGSGINLDNQVTVDPTVNVLLYSPCNIRKANQSTYYGQIYSDGKAQFDNQLVMEYKPLPVFGVQASTTIESYTLEILYKRENL